MLKKVYSERSSDEPSRAKLEKRDNLFFPDKENAKKAWLNDKNIYQEAQKDPVKFWERLAGEIFWRKKWDKGFEHNPPYFKWFLNGKLNIAENCLDRNVKDRKNKIAIIWEPEPAD